MDLLKVGVGLLLGVLAACGGDPSVIQEIPANDGWKGDGDDAVVDACNAGCDIEDDGSVTCDDDALQAVCEEALSS